jgi:hypothetical protein
VHPLLKAALRALLVLGVIGGATALVVNRGGGADPAGSSTARSPRATASTTTTSPGASATPADPPVDAATAGDGSEFTGSSGSSGSFTEPDAGTESVDPSAASVVTTAPVDAGPPPTVPESSTPWLLPVTGAVTLAAGAGIVVWRRSRARDGGA